MTREDIKTVVVDVLEGVVAAIGGTMPPLDDDTKPVGALPHFDSILAEDATVEIYGRFGLEASLDVNPFFKREGTATLCEVVDRLHTLVNQGA